MTRTYETTYNGHTFKVVAITQEGYSNDSCTLTINGKQAEHKEFEYAFNDMHDTLIHVFTTLGGWK